jgi:hypothetical protein
VLTRGSPISGDYAGAARAHGPQRDSIAFRTLSFPLKARARVSAKIGASLYHRRAIL